MVLGEEENTRLDALFRKHYPDVFTACLRFAAGDRQWAMDRCQDVFMKLADELVRLGDLDDLGGWLYRVAVNACLMDVRRKKRWQRIKEVLWQAPTEFAASPERQVQAQRDVSEIELAIGELPSNEQALMVLVYLDGKSQSEAAELLGFSKGHLSKLHKKALSTLEQRDWEVRDG